MAKAKKNPVALAATNRVKQSLERRNYSNSKESPQARWSRKNPKATWAHSCLRSALKRGLIKRGCCEVCGNPETDGHHADYSKPMDVQWLCRKHHKAVHKADNNARG